MRASLLALLAILCASAITPCHAQPSSRPATAAAGTPTSLPVRRVVLYKSGVGFFEHRGEVRGRENVTIRFTSRQLNDVLKSLTTTDPKGQVSGISYNSVAPIDERLNALRLPLGAAGTAFDLMGTLRGARVEVAGRSSVAQGRLLGVERKVIAAGDRDREVQEFSIVTDAGVVRSFELTPAVSVRVIERDMRQEIGRYLDVIGSTREQDVRNVVISTTGAGPRPLFVSYISEVPIWKSTPKALERPLGPVLAKKAEVIAAEAKLRDLHDKQSAIVSDQQRLRENMKALRGSSEEKLLLQRYTRQLDEQETALDALRQLVSATTIARDALLRELSALIANLSFDVSG